MLKEFICTKCNILQPINNFNLRLANPHGYSYNCKNCTKILRKEKYIKNKENNNFKSRENLKNRIEWLRNLKKNIPCADCKQIYDPVCMDFDHIPERGKKLNNITRLVLNNAPKDIILKEIEKCELVCVLCHNLRTEQRFNEKLGTKTKYNKINIEIINNFKNNPCYLCGNKYDLCNMQIDHIDPSTRLYYICDLKKSKLEKLLSELKKCRVICALCHRIKSITEQKEKLYDVDRQMQLSREDKKLNLKFDEINRTKECSTCGEVKNWNLFNKKKKSNILYSSCRDCLKKND